MSDNWRKGKRVAIVGAGPGGVSAALEFLAQGFDVRIFEKNPDPKPLGGGVILSTPVLAILRRHGVDLSLFGESSTTYFTNHKRKTRAIVPHTPEVEKAFGIQGWQYGILRSYAFGLMLEKLPEGIVQGDKGCTGYEEKNDEIIISFEDGSSETADFLVGADGINSVVSAQAFGKPDLFHLGIRLFLAWCEDFGGIDRSKSYITHSKTVQASYFPMMHHGKKGWEWWIVEKSNGHTDEFPDVEAHMRKQLEDFADPLPRFPDHTDFSTQCFRWEIYNRESLDKWCTGRVACLGDAVHPVSPYAAYGMGMAIEDGYFLARALSGKDLSNQADITAACDIFESERVSYVNGQVEAARRLGNTFHKAPAPAAWLRDTIFDYTPALQRIMNKNSVNDSIKMSLSLQELHLNPSSN